MRGSWIAPLTLLLVGLIAAATEIRGPAPDFVPPDDQLAAIMSDPIVRDPGGGERLAGQILVTVEAWFDTSALAHTASRVQLLSDDPPSPLGTRAILIRVPERDFQETMERVRQLRGVRYVDPNGIARID